MSFRHHGRAGRRLRSVWRHGATLLLALLLGACIQLTPTPKGPPLYPQPAPAMIDWREALVKRLPPLRFERGDRWPLVLWHGVGSEPLTGLLIRRLLERGVVQHLRLRNADIEAARRLAAAGAPVVLMEGAGGAWPYDLVAGERHWRLRFPSDAKMMPSWRRLPDPTLLAGWRRAAERTRQRLMRYRSAGVTVDAVWLDYEGALRHADYRAVRASTAATRLPRAALASRKRYRDYRRVHWLARLSRYLASPVRRVYAQVAVTNWGVMLSSATHPVLNWTDWPHPPSPPLFFTHTNPIAYGIDTYFLAAWPAGQLITRVNVDRFYTHLLLRQVSADALNRARQRPDMGAVVWVARWVPDHPEQRVPVMSRAAYREALRHIWLRGAAAMQVFNPAREGYERYALWEVEDVQRVYAEMLRYRQFLEHGEIMNFTVPDKRDAGVAWSGLRLGGRAVIRITNLGGENAPASICVAGDHCLEVPAPGHGRTYNVDL